MEGEDKEGREKGGGWKEIKTALLSALSLARERGEGGLQGLRVMKVIPNF